MRRRFAVLAAMSFFSRGAAAQDVATAAAQFDRGLSEMEAGHLDKGCPALAESYRLDPRPGVLFTLAECETKWNKVASAAAHYDDYLSRFAQMTVDEQSKQRGREKIAAQHRTELRDGIPQLTIGVPQPVPAGLVVKRDGVVLGSASFGVALPVDPGDHLLFIETSTGTREQPFSIARGEKKTVTVDYPNATVMKPVVIAPVPDAVEADDSHPLRALTYAAFGVGLAGLTVGTVTGLLALDKKDQVQQGCKGNVCTADGKLAADSAQRTALVSTIAFAVGGGGVAAGLILLLVAPSPPKSRSPRLVPMVGSKMSGAILEASW